MAVGPGTRRLGGQAKPVPTLVAPLHQLGARVGRCLPLTPLHALAFVLGTHRRLGAGATGLGAGGRRKSRRLEGKEPDAGRGCACIDMTEDLVQQVVERCRNWPEGARGRRRGWCGWWGAGDEGLIKVACKAMAWTGWYAVVVRGRGRVCGV